jgi:hypothetical protein
MMAADRQDEIAASVAALQDLGPGYDQALAEGLVERIGAEIDKRIAAEVDNRVTAEVDGRILAQLDRYAGCRHQRRRARRISRAERRMARAERADRSGLQSIMLAVGSMLVALPVTAIVLKGPRAWPPSCSWPWSGSSSGSSMWPTPRASTRSNSPAVRYHRLSWNLAPRDPH